MIQAQANPLPFPLSANERRFREVERRAADVIEAITNSGIKYDEEDEVVNVCQAIQEMRKESERDGELKKAREAIHSSILLPDSSKNPMALF